MEFSKHLINYPSLFSGTKIAKYLIRNKESQFYESAIKTLIDYLYSDENLYQETESNILEIFLMLPNNFSTLNLMGELKKLGYAVFFKDNYKPLSEYARALACLLIYKYDNENIEDIINNYTEYQEHNSLLRKYLIFVCLTTNKHDLRQAIFDRAKKEQDISINRLINLIENIKKYKNMELIERYINKQEIYIYYNKEKGFEIKENYSNIRGEILKQLISNYG